MAEQVKKLKEANIPKVTSIICGILPKLNIKNMNNDKEKFNYSSRLLDLTKKVQDYINENVVFPKEDIEKIQMLEIKRKRLNNDFRKTKEKSDKNNNNYLNTYDGGINLLEKTKNQDHTINNIDDYVKLHELNINQIENQMSVNLNTGSTYIIIYKLKNSNKCKVIQPIYSKSEKQIYRRNGENNSADGKNKSGILIENLIVEQLYGMACFYLNIFFSSNEKKINKKEVNLSFIELEVYSIDISSEMKNMSKELEKEKDSDIDFSKLIDNIIKIMKKMKKQVVRRKEIKIEPGNYSEVISIHEKGKRKLEHLDSQNIKYRKLDNETEKMLSDNVESKSIDKTLYEINELIDIFYEITGNEMIDVDMTISDLGEIPEINKILSHSLPPDIVNDINKKVRSELNKCNENQTLESKDSNQYTFDEMSYFDKNNGDFLQERSMRHPNDSNHVVN